MRSEVRNLPELFISRLKALSPPQKFDSIANTFTEIKPTTFRINTLRTNSSEVKQTLENQSFQLSSVSWFSNAFILKRGLQKDLEKTKAYLEGQIYVQSLSSMIPPLVLEPKPGENILDLTAAPGGKTLQIACLMEGQGKVIANESDRLRFEKLRANVALQKAVNIETVLSYGESFGNKHPGGFDRVLLDAPCTAEGRFLTSQPASYRYWNLKKIQQMAKLQKKLLLSGLKCLKPGGILVYSTCTFSPEENESVVDYALKTLNHLIDLEIIKLPIQNQIPGFQKWNSGQFNRTLKRTVRVLPTSEMEGFFVARILKKR